MVCRSSQSQTPTLTAGQRSEPSRVWIWHHWHATRRLLLPISQLLSTKHSPNGKMSWNWHSALAMLDGSELPKPASTTWLHRSKNLEGSGLYAPAANVQAVQENIIQRDRGVVDPSTGQRTGRNIIQNVTQSVQPKVNQDITYNVNRDPSTGQVVNITQDVKTNVTPARASQNAQDAFNAFNNTRGYRRDDENINTP